MTTNANNIKTLKYIKSPATAKLFYPDDQDYDFLTFKYRTLYWTAQLFVAETANIEKPYDFEKHQITEQIGGRVVSKLLYKDVEESK